jgi:adenine phosphoribosyltransferase
VLTVTAPRETPPDGVDLTNRSVLIVDDVLATGGTVSAAVRLLDQAGATVTGAAVLLELTDLNGREVLTPLPVTSLHRV